MINECNTCHNMMLPVKKDGQVVLHCSKCNKDTLPTDNKKVEFRSAQRDNETKTIAMKRRSRMAR